MLTETVSREMIPVYSCLNVMFLKFLFIHEKKFLHDFCMISLAKPCQRIVIIRRGENFMWFCFCFILKPSFTVQR